MSTGNRKLMPAVVLSSHTMGLAVIRALGMMGVPVVVFYYDKNDMGYVSKYVSYRKYLCHPEKNEEEFIQELKEYARQNGDAILIPADDATLTVVSKHKSDLERYFIVACPEWEITERYIDKKFTYTIADEAGVPVPHTILPYSIKDIEKSEDIIRYPCIVKPCKSHQFYEVFNKKYFKADNYDQLVAAYRLAVESGIKVMIQEYIPGEDHNGANYSSYFWNGEAITEYTSEKFRLSPPESGVPCVVRSKFIPEIVESGRQVLKSLGFYGYSCIEFKKDDRDGIYKLMEVNGRYNRSNLLSLMCGLNYPWIEYKHLVHGELPAAQVLAGNEVYWIDEFRDFFNSPGNLKRCRYSLLRFNRPYLRKHVFSIFDRKDLKPFLKRCADLFKMSLKVISSASS